MSERKLKQKILSVIGTGVTLSMCGGNSVALAAPLVYGDGATAKTETSLAIGQNAKSTNTDTTALGAGSSATSWHTTALGAKSIAKADSALSVGVSAQATGMDATALGSESISSATNTTSVGKSSVANKENSTALGTYSTAKGADSTAIGVASIASGEYTTAIGDNAKVTGFSSTGIGADIVVSGNDSVALGVMAEAKGAENSVFGFSAKATMDNGTAIGSESLAKGENATAIGAVAKATADNTLALGHNSNASGVASMALGVDSKSIGSNSVALGKNAVANNKDAMAIGVNASSKANNAIAIGVGSEAKEENTVSIGKEKATRRLVNVTAGINDTDAVNVSQLRDNIANLTNDFDNKLVNKADINLGNITKAGEQVIRDIVGSSEGASAKVTSRDKNLRVSSSVDGNNPTVYDIGLSRTIEADRFSVGSKTYISENGLNANYQKITNVDNGNIAADSKDAVNGGQLHTVQADLNTRINNILNGVDSKLEGKANINLDNLSSEGKKVITDLANASSETTEIHNSDNNLVISSNKNGNVTTYDVNLSNNINASSYSVNGKEFISAIGINANNTKIINVADGSVEKGSKDAVNGGQLYEVKEAITNAVGGDLTNKTDVDLKNISIDGKTVIMDLAESGEKTTSVKSNDKNIKISSETNGNNTEYTLNLVDDITSSSFSVGGKTYINENGLNANNQKIVNVAEGNVSEDSTDAINGAQLHKVKGDIVTRIKEITKSYDDKLEGKANINLSNISPEGRTIIADIAKSVEDTTEVGNTDGNLTVTSSKTGNVTKYDVNLSSDISASSYRVGEEIYISAIGINANNHKIVNVANGEVSKDSKDAVNGGQLYEVAQSVANNVGDKLTDKVNSSLDNITKEGEKVITDLAKLSDTTAVVESEDDNISVSSEESGNKTTYKLKLADNIRAQSFGIGDKIYISADGLNANNQRIANVANGIADTDAVNVGQLKEAIATSKNSLAVEYDSDKKNVVTLKGNNGTTITNIKAGAISKNSTDAVNGSQLYETNERIAQNSSDIKSLRSNMDSHTEELHNINLDVKNNTTSISQNTTDIKFLQEADKVAVKYTDSTGNAISLLGSDGTRIKNVAAAVNDDEAVNLKQLNRAINGLTAKGDKNVVHYVDDSHKMTIFDGEGGTILRGVADGDISANSSDTVNGSQLYKEKSAREKADNALDARIGIIDSTETYHHIKANNSVSNNLVILDKAIANGGLVRDNGKEITIADNSATKVVNVSGKDGSHRVITGIDTDIRDGSSAANVDYVNRQSEDAKQYAEGIGAHAAAMASLHPLEWDKKDKMSISASVGSYKSNVAGAIGAYYRPERKTLISLQTSLGNDGNMVGVGLSKNFGKEETPEIDNEQLQERLEQISKENAELKEKNVEFQTKLDEMSEAYSSLLQKVDSLMAAKE